MKAARARVKAEDERRRYCNAFAYSSKLLMGLTWPPEVYKDANNTTVKLIDFGFSRDTTDAVGMTASGIFDSATFRSLLPVSDSCVQANAWVKVFQKDQWMACTMMFRKNLKRAARDSVPAKAVWRQMDLAYRKVGLQNLEENSHLSCPARSRICRCRLLRSDANWKFRDEIYQIDMHLHLSIVQFF